MSIIELPIELLQLIIDIAVQHTDLQRAIRFRETCRQFNEVVQNSIFHLPKNVLLQKRLSMSMRRKLVSLKMLRGDADELLLCYTINYTADYLVDRTTTVSRDRYVQVLESCAVNTLMYWRLLDCLTTERQRYIPLEELKDNALVAAVGAGEMAAVRKLLEEGANPASNTPLFGEPLAVAASSGSLDMVHLLLTRWNWEDRAQLTGLRLVKAIETAAVAGHESVLAELLNHKDRFAWSAYDDAIVHMIECNHTASVERLLALRQEDSKSAVKAKFWHRIVRTAAQYGRQTLLEQFLAEHLLDIGKFSLVTAMQDACLENHGHMLQIMTPHLSVSDQTRDRHHDSVFWAAWHGNVEALQHLLTFLHNNRRSLLVAFAGAVSGKASGAIEYLFKVADVSPVGGHVATRFTDIARLMHSETSSDVKTESDEPILDLIRQFRAAVRMGELADVINLFDAIQARPPYENFSVSAAFSSAANHKQLDILLFLCENWSPRLVTPYLKSPAAAQIFIDYGWDICQIAEGLEFPRFRSFVCDQHFARWLLDKGTQADARGRFSTTAVSAAIMHASVSTIKLMLNRSSGIQEGYLLNFAVQREGEGSFEIVELLLNLGCPTDSICLPGDPCSWLQGLREPGTALSIAAEQGRDYMVAYLLSRGVDATLASNKGPTA